MSYRLIKDSIWQEMKDEKFSDSEKLLYIFLFTNPFLHISGIYLLPKTMLTSHFSAFSSRKVSRLLTQLSRKGKIFYDKTNSIIFVKRLFSHQVQKDLFNIKKSVDAQLARFPNHPFVKKFEALYRGGLGKPLPLPLSEAPCGGTTPKSLILNIETLNNPPSPLNPKTDTENLKSEDVVSFSSKKAEDRENAEIPEISPKPQKTALIPEKTIPTMPATELLKDQTAKITSPPPKPLVFKLEIPSGLKPEEVGWFRKAEIFITQKKLSVLELPAELNISLKNKYGIKVWLWQLALTIHRKNSPEGYIIKALSENWSLPDIPVPGKPEKDYTAEYKKAQEEIDRRATWLKKEKKKLSPEKAVELMSLAKARLKKDLGDAHPKLYESALGAYFDLILEESLRGKGR